MTNKIDKCLECRFSGRGAGFPQCNMCNDGSNFLQDNNIEYFYSNKKINAYELKPKNWGRK